MVLSHRPQTGGLNQQVQTFELFNPNQSPVLANLKTADLLPALTTSVDIGTSA